MPLSAKQMEYLALAWQCFESEPKIDYEKFATVAGLKTPASARELMRVTKNKLRDEYGALSSNLQTVNGAVAPRTPSKKATGGGGTGTATPGSRKRARKSPEKTNGNGVAYGDGDDDEELPPVGKSKKARTTTTAAANAGATTTTNGAERAGVEVKSEPLPGRDGGLGGGEEEVSFF